MIKNVYYRIKQFPEYFFTGLSFFCTKLYSFFEIVKRILALIFSFFLRIPLLYFPIAFFQVAPRYFFITIPFQSFFEWIFFIPSFIISHFTGLISPFFIIIKRIFIYFSLLRHKIKIVIPQVIGYIIIFFILQYLLIVLTYRYTLDPLMFHGGQFLCILYAINNILYILPSKSYNLEMRLSLYSDFEEFYLPMFFYYGIKYWHFDNDEPISIAPYDQEFLGEALDVDYVNLLMDNATDYSDIKRVRNRQQVQLYANQTTPFLEPSSLSQEPPKTN